MPLSEPMKAALLVAITLAITLAIAVAVATYVIVNAIGHLTSAVKGETIGTYAGVRGFAGGLFEDRLDLD